MSAYFIHLAKQDLLHHMLQVGGVAVCPLQRPEQTIHASFEVELTDDSAVIRVNFVGHTGELTLKRSDRANHLHLRDFIQDIANGRIESAEPASPPEQTVQLLEALPTISAELAEVFRCVDAVIGEGQIAYVTPTKSSEYPYGAVVADQQGRVCAAAMGKSKEGLAELIRMKLLPRSEGLGEEVA